MHIFRVQLEPLLLRENEILNDHKPDNLRMVYESQRLLFVKHSESIEFGSHHNRKQANG